MAVFHTDTTQTSDFPSHPTTGNKLKGVNEEDDDDHQQQQPELQDTVAFEDTFVVDSPLMEATQVVDYSDFDDTKNAGMCEYEEEVVLDSEDEEVNGSRIVNVKINAGLSSIHFDGGKGEGSAPVARLNYIDSQEPGESSQANALGFVDHFVSSNEDHGGSPGTDHTKPVTVKSPPVSSTKGSLRLARMINLGAQVEKEKPFEWVDPPKERRWGVDRKCVSSGGESNERNVIQSLREEITGSQEKIENQVVNDSEEQLDTISAGLHSEACDVGIDIVDMFDVGFNTQIAAEAMEALAYGDHLDCNSDDAHRGMENSAVVVSRGAMENQVLLDHPSLGKSGFPNIGDINKNAKRRKRSTRTVRRVAASSHKKSQSRKLDPDLAAKTKVKSSRFFADYCSTASDANGNVSEHSPKPTKRRKLERDAGSNLRVLENNLCSPISIGHSLLGKGRSQGDCKNDSSVSHGPNNAGERKNNVMEDGIITYRRKKRSLNARPSDIIIGAEGGGNELVERMNKVKKNDIITYKREKRTSVKENCSKSLGDRNRQSNSLKVHLWSHPKGKRTHLNGRSNSRIATVLYTSFPIVDGKDSAFHCDEMLESSNTMKKKTQSVQYSCPPQPSLDEDSGGSLLRLQSEKVDGSDPTSLVNAKSHTSVTSSSAEHTAPSNSTTGINVGSSKHDVAHDYHKKPCNKNLPKSSLLKELIGLGVPESISDFTWKDLRRRRNMACVRVLFSQHLDDDIIKQQKKVIARLGLSLASCSSDATHFIADQFARTRNMLEFIALGKPVVTHLWLESCGQANCLVSEKSYILRDAKKEKEIGFSMLVSLDCARRCPLLKGQKVFITPNVKPDRDMMISLVKAVQGQPVEKVQISAANDIKSLDDLLILSCEEDRAIRLPFLEKGEAVYSSELLLNGIVIQRLEYKRHRLFTTPVKRNYPYAFGFSPFHLTKKAL